MNRKTAHIILGLLLATATLWAKTNYRLTTFSVRISASTNVSCYGGNNGTATASASNGTAPYTYLWSNGMTGASATGLSAGTYTVTANDAASHTATATVTITQPSAALSATIATQNVTCNGDNNGKATVTGSGGTTPYIYSWAPSGGTKATASSLSPGSYTVTVSDKNGCTTTASATITQPNALTISPAQVIDVLCNGATTGFISTSVNGGTLPYTYLWTPGGSTSATLSGIGAGTYTQHVTDANGCKASLAVTITQPAKLTATVKENDAVCYGSNTGSATVTASGGTPGYTYSWAPSGGTQATATGLGAGAYTVTVTDANSCSITATTTIGQPTQLTASITSSANITCYGAYTGSATVGASGGTGAYKYSWAPAGGTQATASGINAGTYTATVTDKNGCMATATVTITQPTTPFVATATSTGSCGTNSNSASVTVSGGSSPYTYSWSPSGGTSTAATGLGTGIYTVKVTDANGCVTSSSVNVKNLTGPSVSVAPAAVTIYSGQNVTVTTSVTGGATPYVYSWAPATSLSCTNCPYPVASPTTNIVYTVTVADANGCTNSASSMVDVGTAPTVQTPVSCDTCIGGLNLIPGKTYLVSVWAKNNVSHPSDTGYAYPSVKVEFGSTIFGPFTPQGEIIDGWQRIEGTFTVPTTAAIFNIVLSCKGGDCNFDDIRVFPFNGTLKTYVYDPNTLRLVAVLDERNYATIYEYDEEGKLIRVKKETERGIMTIQESRTAMQKR